MFSSLKQLYFLEVNEEIAKVNNIKPGFFSEHELACLPVPVQRYFHYCGYIGREKMLYANIEWVNTYLKLSRHSEWKKIECIQFNGVTEPARVVYMKSTMLGFIPFEGRDKYKGGHGNMKIKLLNCLNVADAKGREMDASALVTILAETLLVPSYALQGYIAWKPLNNTSAKATITYNGTKVSGTFYFAESGRFLRFETDDRYYSERGRSYKRMKWSADAKCYKTINGISFPTFFKATWHTPEGNYTYYKGWIKNISFNGRPNYEADSTVASVLLT